MEPEIRVALTLTGRFDPVKISSAVELSPTNTWRCGAQIGNTELFYKYDGWQIATETDRTLDLNSKIIELMHIISPKVTKFEEIGKNLNIEVDCAISLDDDQQPEISISREVIRFVAALNASLDIDIY